jgi:WD40 repeat protein
MHTPGGPLKYSLEGHVFAVFGFKLTSDFRYIVSVSNQFISWDISSSDLARQVNPKVEGLMMGLEISPDNRYIAAYTNNDQTILLNNLTSGFKIIDNPFQDNESMAYNDSIQGLILLDTNLIIYGTYAWVLFDNSGTRIRLNRTSWITPILEIRMESLSNYSFIHWSGDMNNTDMALVMYKDDDLIQPLEFHNGIALNKTQTKVYVCSKPGSHDIQMYEFRHGQWYEDKNYENKEHPLVEIKLSQDEQFIIGTHMTGFILWKTTIGMSWKRGFGGLGGVASLANNVSKPKWLNLPPGIRNVAKKMNKSNSCILSSGHKYAIAGIRKQMYIWNVNKEELVKCFDAHFGRIIDVQSLTMGDWNLAISSSIDRTVKVCNIDLLLRILVK